MKKLCILVLPLFLAGCGLPPAFAIASYAVDGILLLTSGKTSTDHAISIVAQQDCAMWRIIQGEEICTDYQVIEPGEDGIALAEADIDADSSADGTIEVAALETSGPSDKAFGTPTFRKKKASTYTAREDVPSRSFGKPSPTYRKAKSATPTTAEVLPAAVTPVDTGPLVGEIPVKVSTLSDIPAVPRSSEVRIVETSVHPDIEAAHQMAALGIADDSTPVAEPLVRVSRRSAILVKNTVLPKVDPGIEKGKFLVLGSFADKTYADRFSSGLTGFDTMVISADVMGKTYYRVLLDPVSDQSLAQAKRHVAKTGSQAWSVTLCHNGESETSCPAGS